jgi:hypothetical protein
VTLARDPGPDRITLEHIGPSGEHLGRLGETTGLVRASLAAKVNGPIPFSPFPHAATHGDVVYLTNGSQPLVTARSATGQWTIAFPAHDHDAGQEWTALVGELERRRLQPFVGVVSTAPRPDSIPHLSGLLIDDAGLVWAKRYDPRTDAIWLGGGARGLGGTWWVADSAGRVVASVQVPVGFAPLEIQDARVIGVSVDSLGVERVEVRAISR